MPRFAYALPALVTCLLAACGAETGDAGAPPTAANNRGIEAQPSAGEVVAKDPAAIQLGVMHWPEGEFRCTFIQAAHEFDQADPSTWHFVFATPANAPSPVGFARINGERVRFRRALRTVEDVSERWRYEARDSDVVLELSLKKTGDGPEHSRYSGTISVIEPVEREKLGITGSCAVSS